MSFDEALTRAVDTMGERLRDGLARELRQLSGDLSAAAKASREAEIAQPERGAAWLLNAVRAMDSARSLSQVLDALVMGASREAARAGVLMLQGGRLRGRQFVGFPATLDGTRIDVAREDAGIIAVAVSEGRLASSSADGPPPPFAGLVPGADGVEAVACPVAVGGEVVAVLYVDRPDAGSGRPAIDVTLLEVLARHAARTLEALTAFKAAQNLTRADTGSMGGAPVVNREGDDDEAARRYARLVISEIKLYHEDAVAEGRVAGDLATRLGGEIARARALYEQRVPAHFRAAAEYFQAELVRTLAGGDPALFAKESVA